MHERSEWRLLEQTVAAIEAALGGAGVTVKSPDVLTDLDSGEPREVDATVRLTAGSVPVLIVVECRKRRRREDVRWVEQLAQKRKSVGADVIIAVSSVGFSPSAVEKARRLGVVLRCLKEQPPDDATWIAPAPHLTWYRWTLHRAGFELPGVDGGEEVAIWVRKRLEPVTTERPLVREVATGRQLSAADLVATGRSKGLDLWQGVEPDGPAATRHLRVDLPMGAYSIAVPDRSPVIVAVELDIEVETHTGQGIRFAGYCGTDGQTYAERAEAVVSAGDPTARLGLTMVPGLGLSVSLEVNGRAEGDTRVYHLACVRDATGQGPD